jgi:hypothetical protein
VDRLHRQFNMTGQPAATVPAGFTKDGLPIGLQIVGRQLDDAATVLRAAAAYEAAAPWKDTDVVQLHHTAARESPAPRTRPAWSSCSPATSIRRPVALPRVGEPI